MILLDKIIPKTVQYFPLFSFMVNYHVLILITIFIYPEMFSKVSISLNITQTYYQKRVTFCNCRNRSSHRKDCF